MEVKLSVINKVRLVSVLLGAVGISLASPLVSIASEAPIIIISEKNFNFGELSEKTPVVRDFNVKNGGRATLNIKDVQPS